MKKTRIRRKILSEWKANKIKKRYNHGKNYNSKNSGKIMNRKKMRPACDNKCIFKCSTKIKESERFSIFQKYWGLGDVSKRRDFISRSTKEIASSIKRQAENAHRNLNVAYYFKVNGIDMRE